MLMVNNHGVCVLPNGTVASTCGPDDFQGQCTMPDEGGGLSAACQCNSNTDCQWQGGGVCVLPGVSAPEMSDASSKPETPGSAVNRWKR